MSGFFNGYVQYSYVHCTYDYSQVLAVRRSVIPILLVIMFQINDDDSEDTIDTFYDVVDVTVDADINVHHSQLVSVL
jgi:hypothetical protein